MISKYKKSHFLYILITSLFYPAVLGAIFCLLLEDFFLIAISINKLIYVLASLGIVISFSVDFVYTYAAKSFYSTPFFIFDMLIISFLFISYKNLLEGLKFSKEISLFYIGFTIIHVIFAIWDIYFVPDEKKSFKLIIYDVSGIFLSFTGFIFFNQNPLIGVFFLWLFTFNYIFIGLKEIINLLNIESILTD